MNRKELENKLLELVAKAYAKDVSDLSLETNFRTDLGGASVQMVALIAEIENELDVFLMASEASKAKTIAEMADLVEANA